MASLAESFESHPELAVFLALGVGHVLGRIKIKGIPFGTVPGALVAALVVGYLFPVPDLGAAQSVLFLLFVFGLGYSMGPMFFANMKGDGWRWAVLGVFVPTVGFGTAWAVARALDLDPGFAAGMLSGSLTAPPAIGTASEAIRALPLVEDVQDKLIGHIAVADAMCYVFGAFGVIWFCTALGPRLLGIDPKAEAERIERALGLQRSTPGVRSGWQPFVLRAYRIEPGMPAAGMRVADAERLFPGERLFAARIRRSGRILAVTPDTVLDPGDVVAVSGHQQALIDTLGDAAEEVADSELLDLPMADAEILVTSRDCDGMTLAQIASATDARGVFVRAIRRGDVALPVAPGTVIRRGDHAIVHGPAPTVERIAGRVGLVLRPDDETDLGTLGLAICVGVVVGTAVSFPVAGLRIALGTSVGTLVAGLLVGWLHSVRPVYGRFPDAAIALMRSLGLAAFVATIGLKAGPIFTEAISEVGVSLFLGGAVVTLTPQIAGLLFGRYVLRLEPLLLLGGLAGAQTMTPALAALQERSGSTVAVLGYSGTTAFGNILLTAAGALMVAALA